MVNSALKYEDVDAFELQYEHYNELQNSLGYETVWSMDMAPVPLDHAILTAKPRLVTYSCIAEMGESMDDVTWKTFTAVAEDGTVGALWKAAESCYQQAKAIVGDWHYFVEDFNLQDDGSLKLVTGS